MLSYSAAEKDDEGMALKILTQAEDMSDGKDKLESYAYTKSKRAPTFCNIAGVFLTSPGLEYIFS